MINRILGRKIGEAAQKMPVVAVTGPRQSGKSTLVKQVFPNHAYVNLEAISKRRFATEDPEGFLRNLGGRLCPIEIKSGRTINPHFFDSLRYFQPLSGAQPEESFLVYGGDEVQHRSIAHVLGWQHLEKIPC